MNRKALFRKIYKNHHHDYEIEETISVEDDEHRKPDICFLYSGRNRGKSFEVSSQLIADAWFDKKLFGYVRRHDATTYEVEQYFEDKKDFIRDMTDGTRDGITKDHGKLKLYKDEIDKNGDIKRVKYEEVGYFFALSRQASYKSLQYPDVYNLVYEEVLSDSYLSAEPEKLMNLYSTVRRSKEGFRMWLISNTISVVNPYSSAWGINIARIKPGELKLSKLFLGSMKEEKEDYLLIVSHYLQNKDDLPKDELKKKKNRINTAISSNKWEELKLYHNIPIRFMKQYKIIETVIVEYNDLMFQCDIMEVPSNLLTMYQESTEDEPIEPSRQMMPILYIRRKTTEPKERTRIYTNNANRLSEYVTKGFTRIYKIDRIVGILIDRGWIMGADNLTMNDFDTAFHELWCES